MKNEVISEEKVDYFREEIKKIKTAKLVQDKRVVVEKGTSSIRGDRRYSLALARIILSKDNPCACIKIEEERILWSTNRKDPVCRRYSEEVIKILFELITSRDSSKKEECKIKLLERAIIKDRKQFANVKGFYTRELANEGDDVVKAFESALANFEECFKKIEASEKQFGEVKKKEFKFTIRKTKKEKAKEELEKNIREISRLREAFFESRGELINFLLEKSKSENRKLPHRYFWPFLNIYDTKLLFSQIDSEQSQWWARVSKSLGRNDGVFILPSELLTEPDNQHAEQRMLEVESDSFYGMSKTLHDFSNSQWVAITLSLCLLCEITLSSCEKEVFRQDEGGIAESCRTNGKVPSRWKSFRLEDNQENKQIREGISNCWEDMVEEVLGKLNGDASELEKEDLWIEQTTLEENFLVLDSIK